MNYAVISIIDFRNSENNLKGQKKWVKIFFDNTRVFLTVKRKHVEGINKRRDPPTSIRIDENVTHMCLIR